MQAGADGFHPRADEMDAPGKALFVSQGQAGLAALKDLETKLFIQQFEAVNQQGG